MAIIKNIIQNKKNGSQSQTQSNSSTDNDLRLDVRNEYDEDSGLESDTPEDVVIAGVGSELCMVNGQTCSVPYELFDLPDLKQILSFDTWNNCLTEEERFQLAAYLPDMDQHTFCLTLKQLFDGEIFHFTSPITELSNIMKGGLCPPKVFHYKKALQHLQRREHYHRLRSYHNNMVKLFNEMQGVFKQCNARASSEERLSLWYSSRNNSRRVKPETRLLALTNSMPASQLVKKNKISKQQLQSCKLAKSLKTYSPTDNVHPPAPEKGLTTMKVDGKGVLKIKPQPKPSFPTEVCNTKVELREPPKTEKRMPKGVLKVANSRPVKTEIPQILPEVGPPPTDFQAFETSTRPFFQHQGVVSHDYDAYNREQSLSQLRRTISAEEEEDVRLLQHRFELPYATSVSGNYVGPPEKKPKKVKQQPIIDMKLQIPHLYNKQDRHKAKEGIVDMSLQIPQLYNKQDGRKGKEERVAGKRYAKDVDNRRFSQDAMPFTEDPSNSEQPRRHIDVQSREYHQNSIDGYSDRMDRSGNHYNQSFPFEQQANRELGVTGTGRAYRELGMQGVPERSKKRRADAKQITDDPFGITNGQRFMADGYREDQSYYEGQANFMDRRQSFGTGSLQENSKLIGQGKRPPEPKRCKTIQSGPAGHSLDEYEENMASEEAQAKKPRKKKETGAADLHQKQQAFEMHKTPKIKFKQLPDRTPEGYVQANGSS